MFGSNPIRAAETHDGSVLDVVEIFYTIQGEGPRAGQPAMFIRLGGCNLACNFCDTEFEHFAPMTVDEVVKNSLSLWERGGVRAITDSNLSSPHPNPLPKGEGTFLIVITGGEPLRQNIVPLCEALLAAGCVVQIETNGTLWRPLPEAVEVVCSPKNTGRGYMPIRPDVLARVTALKYIISATHPLYQTVPDFTAQRGIPIFVQPMDEGDEAKNAANKAYTVALAMKHGWRVSLRLHKWLGIS